MAEESCLPWFHPARGGVHTWQQAWRQHDSWGNTLSFSQIKTHPPRQILMTSKTFHAKSAQPLTGLTFDWQGGYPTLRPWSPPPLQLREQIMSNMGEVGNLLCQMSKEQLLFSVNSLVKDKKSEGKSHPGLIFFRDVRWVKSFQSLIWSFNSDVPRRILSSYTETAATKKQPVSWGTLLQVWERRHMIEDMELEWLSSAFEALSYTLCNINSCKYLWLI